MAIPKKPKKMKDPVLIAGKWEERVAPPETAGSTYIDVKKLDPVNDKEDIEAKSDIPYKTRKDKKK